MSGYGMTAVGAKQTFNPTIAAHATSCRPPPSSSASVNEWCGSCLPQLLVLAEPSSCLPVRQHPGTDLGLQHLADFGAGKVIPYFNLLGRFDAPDLLLHEGRYRGDIDSASSSRLNHSDNTFAPLLVWQTDDGTILNGFVGLKGVLNFDGIDVETASNDHVFCAINDVKEIVRIQVSDITRMMPAVHGGLRRCFRVLVVPIHHQRSTNDDFAAFSGRYQIAVPIHDADP